MLKLLAAIALFGSLLSAQPGQRAGQASDQQVSRPMGRGMGPRPWWDGDLAKNANLSESQQKQVLQIRSEFRPHMREVQRAVDKADADVAAAFNEESVDQAKANEAINRLADARREATKTVSQFSLKLRTVLTAQQWQEMQRPRPWPDRSDRPGGRRRGTSTSTSTSTINQQK
jgi:Spy/CpxP family protein refolding chaperone